MARTSCARGMPSPVIARTVRLMDHLFTARTALAWYELRAALLAENHIAGYPVVLIGREHALAMLPSSEALRAHFSLTMTEARVALLLASRRSNDQIAAALRISTHTARHHTEKVFLKLRVHHRAEVVDRLAPLAAD